MGFFSRFFGNSTPEQPTVNTVVEKPLKRGVSYHPDLVENLKADHQALFALYGVMVDLVNKGRYDELPPKLHEFKMALQGHVLVENVQFYVYLQNKLVDDAMNLEFIKDVRKEMNGIARAVVNFTKKYESIEFTDEVKPEFSEELSGIGAVLTQRVEMEESQLYTLYEP